MVGTGWPPPTHLGKLRTDALLKSITVAPCRQLLRLQEKKGLAPQGLRQVVRTKLLRELRSAADGQIGQLENQAGDRL